jgi:hypothetical protein
VPLVDVAGIAGEHLVVGRALAAALLTNSLIGAASAVDSLLQTYHTCLQPDDKGKQ